MKPVDVNPCMYFDSDKEHNKEGLKYKVRILLEYQNIKVFLQKVTFQIGLKKFLWLKKVKILCREHILLVILTEKKFLERFMKLNCKKQIKN